MDAADEVVGGGLLAEGVFQHFGHALGHLPLFPALNEEGPAVDGGKHRLLIGAMVFK